MILDLVVWELGVAGWSGEVMLVRGEWRYLVGLCDGGNGWVVVGMAGRRAGQVGVSLIKVAGTRGSSGVPYLLVMRRGNR